MRFSKKIFYELLIVLIIIVNEKYFFLTENYESWSYVLIALIFISILVLLMTKHKTTYYFRSYIYIYIFMNLISATITILKYNQPIELAILTYKFNFFILSYFPIKYFIGKIKNYNMEKIMLFLAIVAAFIAILQKFTYGYFNFIYNGIGWREGNFRTIQSQMIVSIAIILFIQYLLGPSEDLKFKSRTRIMLCLIPLLYYTFFISMTRSAELCLLATIFIQFIINIASRMKTYRSKWCWRIFSILILSIVSFWAYNYVMEIIKHSIYLNESSSMVRKYAIQYYWEMFNDNPIFGYGLYNNAYSYGVSIEGGNMGYYTDDVGIFGFIFQYGIMGILTGLYLCKGILHKIKNIKVIERNKYFGLMFYFIIILPFNCLLNIDMAIVYVCLYLAALENLPNIHFSEK